MPNSRSSSPQTAAGQANNINELISQLSVDPEREAIASELGVLQSIYGDDAIKSFHPNGDTSPSEKTRYEVTLSLDTDDEDTKCTVLVSLPTTYPASSPPQLQLLSRYIGAFAVDSALWGAVLRTYISSEGVEWVADTVCVFDGLEWVKERCASWHGTKKSEKLAGELLREDERNLSATNIEEGKNKKVSEISDDHHEEQVSSVPAAIPVGIQIVEAEAIIDRKSAFVGRACRVTDPSQVPLVLAHLMSDRRIARAAHPIINAWRCQVGQTLHQDNDDDGETAAGGRLAHLLQILEVNNVLVIVTRYFGGIHLGPDRFKHINQAARNALELGGFLDVPESTASKKGHARGRKR
ncbi:imprinted and ancient [Irpex rosettiformis]|uniref:Imprinted and ancient n=1 Tax=Irpex rosettiformis TaxID=378272 RepID=A0ACB8UCS7_9APHY|nr:imprinted and ancient [Irpex rosettiformis]